MPRRRYDDDDDDYLLQLRRRKRRRRQSNAVLWIVGSVILGLTLLAVVIVAIVARPSRSERKEDPKNTGDAIMDARNRLADPADGVIPLDTNFPPANWTHEDFADFLRTKGVVVTIQHDPSLRSPHGEGVWFVDTRAPRGGGRYGRIRVYRCPTQRDALRQVAVMRPEVWNPYAAGNFAIGHDSKDDVSDDDIDFSTRLKGAFFQPRSP